MKLFFPSLSVSKLEMLAALVQYTFYLYIESTQKIVQHVCSDGILLQSLQMMLVDLIMIKVLNVDNIGDISPILSIF